MLSSLDVTIKPLLSAKKGHPAKHSIVIVCQPFLERLQFGRGIDDVSFYQTVSEKGL